MKKDDLKFRVLTFIAISQRVAVDVERVVPEEEETEPGLERVDGNDQEDPDDVTLLRRILVVYQVLVDLKFIFFKRLKYYKIVMYPLS